MEGDDNRPVADMAQRAKELAIANHAQLIERVGVLPHVVHVVDKYRIIRMGNEALEAVRRRMKRASTSCLLWRMRARQCRP